MVFHQESSLIDAHSNNCTFFEDKHFLSIKVKKQRYLGEQAIVIFLSDITTKMQQKIGAMQRKESMQVERQTESFTATVSHEMRTPIATSIFFIAMIVKFVTEVPKINSQVFHYLNLVESQLNFLLTFVDDLLDLRQLRFGAFSLFKSAFDPN